MQKDFNNFKADKSLKNAQRVLKHAGNISAQCIFFAEIAEAKNIVEAK